jgi:hypothetical protein
VRALFVEGREVDIGLAVFESTAEYVDEGMGALMDGALELLKDAIVEIWGDVELESVKWPTMGGKTV